MSLSCQDWAYLLGKPNGKGTFKAQNSDFIVIEQLPFPIQGDGEHLFLFIEKSGLNTSFVAQQLAHFFNVKERDVGYAGRKDKFALTRQWFSVHLPGNANPNWREIQIENVRIIKAEKHNKKLRVGALSGNRFELKLRELSHKEEVEERLNSIIHTGVPNYYGPQRFGNRYPDGNYGNLQLAKKLLQGEVIKKRDKRSLAISAMRSWLFNEFLSQRLSAGYFSSAMNGDTMMLAGTNSFFCADNIDDEITTRLNVRDISLSAPLWGKGANKSSGAALSFETSISEQYQDVCNTLESLNLKQERRAIVLLPTDLSWQWEGNDLFINFSLPPGCFATSVLRELGNFSQPE